MVEDAPNKRLTDLEVRREILVRRLQSASDRLHQDIASKEVYVGGLEHGSDAWRTHMVNLTAKKGEQRGIERALGIVAQVL